MFSLCKDELPPLTQQCHLWLLAYLQLKEEKEAKTIPSLGEGERNKGAWRVGGTGKDNSLGVGQWPPKPQGWPLECSNYLLYFTTSGPML